MAHEVIEGRWQALHSDPAAVKRATRRSVLTPFYLVTVLAVSQFTYFVGWQLGTMLAG